MSNLFALLIIIIFALFFKFYLKFKMEEALFCSMASIILLLTVFGIFGLMHAAQYIIYILTLASLVLSAIYLAKRRMKYDYTEIITPGLIVVILSFAIYSIVTKNNVLYIWDEARCYGTAAHYMHVTDTISNGGSVTVFSRFFTGISGYSEHSLFVSKWLFIWIALALPLASVKWGKWYMAAIYALLAFGAVTIIDPEPNYLMDAPAGLMAGAGIAYLSAARGKSRVTVLTLASVLTITVKDNVGLVLLAFMVLFFVVYHCVELSKNKWELSGRDIINIAVYTASITAALLIKQSFMPAELKKMFDMLKSNLALIIILAAALLLFAAAWFAWLRKPYAKLAAAVKKSPAAKKAVSISAISLLPFLLFAAVYKSLWKILYSLTPELQKDFVYALGKYFGKNYFGFTLWQFALVLILAAVLCYFTIAKRENRKSFLFQAISVFAMVPAYGLVVSVLFIKDYHVFLVSSNMLGLERYVGTLVIMVCVWLLSVVFSSNVYWADDKKQYLAGGLALLLLIRTVPLPGETMFASIDNSNMLANKNYVRPAVKEHARIIIDSTPESAKVLIIAIEDEGNQNALSSQAWQYWTYYETVPRPLPDVLDTTLKKNQNMTAEQLGLLMGKYDYVYIGYANQDFYAGYGQLFGAGELYETKALYKTNSGGTAPLELVYAQNHLLD